MKHTPKVVILAFSAFLLVIACHKVNNSRSNDPVPYYGPTGAPPSFPTKTISLNELFKDLSSTPEKQCVTAGIAQTITFAKGTRVTFYPNSFKDEKGNIMTSGTVCIEMVEIYKPGDMIANNATTSTADGYPLISGGEVYIKATKDGQKVYANKYGIAFKHSTTSTQPMYLYYGDRNNRDSVTAWTIANTTLPGTAAAGTTADTGGAMPMYVFDSCTSFTYINCDRLHDVTSPRTTVDIVMSDTGYTEGNTKVFFVVYELNAAVGYFRYSPSSNTYSVGYDADAHKVPISGNASVVILSKKNGQYYYFEQTGLTITNGLTIHASSMTKQTLDYIKTRLAAL